MSVLPRVLLIDEPYLEQVHGPVSLDYAATTGRFVPGAGRLALPATEAVR